MSTVQVLHDEIAAFDAEAAEKFMAQMVDAMKEAPLKNFTTLRGVAASWVEKRDHLKKMATDPSYRAMILGDISERYGVDLPVEDVVTASADEDTETDGDEEKVAA